MVYLVDSTRLRTRLHIRVNPVRKVITMLQVMEEKARKEGDERAKLYEKFLCYCKVTDAELDKSVSKAQDRIPQLQSSIKKASAEKQQLQEELKQQKNELKELKKAMSTAVSVRDQTRAGLVKDQSELKKNTKALKKAMQQIQKGLGLNLLQSDRAFLQRLSGMVDVPLGDRDLLTAFLEGNDQSSDSDVILGILKQMHETMEGDLAKVTKEVADLDIKYEKLLSAQKQEAETLQTATAEKIRLHGEMAVKIATLDAELSDMVEGLEEDQSFRKDLEASCKRKKSEWDKFQTAQATELVAYSETIKLLGQDDAMEAFKKTLPNREESFMQVGMSSRQMRRQALDVLQGAAIRHHGRRLADDPRLDLLELALHGEKVGFDQLIEKIDRLVSNLEEEQKQDARKKVFCKNEIRKAEAEMKQNKRGIVAKEAVVDDTAADLEDLSVGLKELASSMKALDQEVAKATRERKAENVKYSEELASNNVAANLLETAISKLDKFFSKRRYKANLLSMNFKMRHRTHVHHSIGAADPTDSSDGSTSLVQELATRHTRRRPAPPEVELTHKHQEDTVTGLLHHLKRDLLSSAAEMKTEEKMSQADYEKFVKDAADKRALDSKAFSNKERAKADLESALHEDRESLTSLLSSAKATKRELKGLHEDCDWLLANHELRREARTKERAALRDARAVLSGADSD
eukprot:CAMPEP_0172824022 /NCGR_PEP_ID=MMETSP1075-20121228/17723_1 /TAXON_ID=2916 /ORGANISM="Ceratium fusus, Strain PA161109" /LENGTH=690 /DNA_ID=CAMNT_0013665243 /DNA_START=13 /DNA_END=2085 /DNA_ORIENTATION=+